MYVEPVTKIDIRRNELIWAEAKIRAFRLPLSIFPTEFIVSLQQVPMHVLVPKLLFVTIAK